MQNHCSGISIRQLCYSAVLLNKVCSVESKQNAETMCSSEELVFSIPQHLPVAAAYKCAPVFVLSSDLNLKLLFTWLLIIDFIWVWQQFSKLMSCHPFKFCRCRTSCNRQMQISTTRASNREWVPSVMGRATIFRQFRWDSAPRNMHTTVES